MFLTLLPYIASALNLILVLLLFFGLYRTVWSLRNRVGNCEARLNTAVGLLTEEIKGLSLKVSGLEASDDGRREVQGSTLGAGINVTLRSKVLKMHRMGQSLDRIAETLRVPRGEVDLLVKVHRIVMRPYQDGADTVLQDASAQKSLKLPRNATIQQQA